MALSLDNLQAQLDALKTARASGMRSVEYAGRRVEYKSDSEMSSAIQALEQDIADAQGARVVRGFNIVSAKGL